MFELTSSGAAWQSLSCRCPFAEVAGSGTAPPTATGGIVKVAFPKNGLTSSNDPVRKLGFCWESRYEKALGYLTKFWDLSPLLPSTTKYNLEVASQRGFGDCGFGNCPTSKCVGVEHPDTFDNP